MLGKLVGSSDAPMKNPLAKCKDRDLRGTWPAMLRAAKAARELAIQTGTPLYIMRDGKVVDALADHPSRRRAGRRVRLPLGATF